MPLARQIVRGRRRPRVPLPLLPVTRPDFHLALQQHDDLPRRRVMPPLVESGRQLHEPDARRRERIRLMHRKTKSILPRLRDRYLYFLKARFTLGCRMKAYDFHGSPPCRASSPPAPSVVKRLSNSLTPLFLV